MQKTLVRGTELVIGDIIAPWGIRTARINSIKPYVGSLASIWGNKANTAELTPIELPSFHTCGATDAFKGKSITIDPDAVYDVYR
jgi:hypothetical protein